MKTKHLHYSLLIILYSFFLSNKGFSQIVISGYLANPAGSDSSFEYVQLVATEDIDFSVNPYTVVWCNDGTATNKGWIKGLSVTYGFNLSSGTVQKGESFYVGGAMEKINGSGSTDISNAKWIRTIYTGSQNGDGFGTKSSTGNLGNGGSADGIAVFSKAASNIDSATIPIDAVFFGDSVGTSKPATGGYTVANNDRYSTSQGTFGNGTNTYLFNKAVNQNEFIRLSGIYDQSTKTWTKARIASKLTLSTSSVLANIASEIILTPKVTIGSVSIPNANVVRGSYNKILYQLTLDVIDFPAILDSIKIHTFGNYKAADIKTNGYKIWYSSNSTFSTTDSIIATEDAAGPGNIWLRTNSFQIPTNSTAHFFITADIASLATLGDSLYIDSLKISDIYFASAIKSVIGTLPQGAILTIISSTAPIINVTNLNIFYDQVVNSTSKPQNYSISAGNLYPATGNIIITPPAGFEISFTKASGYTNSYLTLPYTAGTINPTEIYVVFKPQLIKTYIGNITHIGGNTTQNLPVTGYGMSSDTIPPKVDTAYAVDLYTVIVKFNEAVDTTAEHTENYVMMKDIASAVRDANLKVVTLTLITGLVKGVPESMSVEAISDTSSNHNVMIPQVFDLFIPKELVINEILANSTTNDDFIEIYNPNNTNAISLKGWHLTNDSSNLQKWAFPDTNIKAGSYLVIWDNQHPANPGLHCSFTLSNTGGKIVLRTNTNTTNAFAKFPATKNDTSWGRFPNTTGSYTFTKPSPGAPNVLYPKVIPTYTIAQIRLNDAFGNPDSVDVHCKLIGIVYGVNFSTYGYSFTIIDNSGGINLYKSTTNITPAYKVKEGDKIKVTGTILPTYYGLTEMGIDTIIKLDSNQTLKSPLVVNVLDETTESNLIKIENLRLVDSNTWPKVAGTAVIVKACNALNDTIYIKIHNKCDLQGTQPPKKKFNIIGIGNQSDPVTPYLGNYQIWPRYKADLEIVNGIESIENPLGLQLYPNPNNGRFVIENPNKSRLTISVLNSVGQEISNCINSQSQISLNITDGAGFYFVKAVSSDGKISILKVVVK